MARRKSSIVNFLEGFNSGWDTVGKVGAAYDINKLDEEQKKVEAARKSRGGLAAGDNSGKYSVFGMEFDDAPTDFDREYARNQAQAKVYDKWGDKETARGLRTDALASRAQGDTSKTQGLRQQQIEQQMSHAENLHPLAVKQATATLESTEAGTTGKNLQNKQTEATMDSTIQALNASNSHMLEKLPEELRTIIANADVAELQAQFNKQSFQPRLDAMAVNLNVSKAQLDYLIQANPMKLQGLVDSNVLAALNIDKSQLELGQLKKIDAVNGAYRDAFTSGNFEGVQQHIMPYAAEIYNNSGVLDDEYEAVAGDDGKFQIVDKNGDVVGTAEDILKSMNPAQVRDTLRMGQAYAVAAITGDNSHVDEMRKTDAWIDYYQAQAEAKRKGTALTKDQWAMARLAKSPNDPLALAMLVGDNYSQVAEDMKDPLAQLGAGGNKPPPLGGETNNDDSEPGETEDSGGGETPVVVPAIPPPPNPIDQGLIDRTKANIAASNQRSQEELPGRIAKLEAYVAKLKARMADASGHLKENLYMDLQKYEKKLANLKRYQTTGLDSK